MRPRSSSTARDTAMIAWSTFAARICPSDRWEEVDRTKAVRRGRYVFTYRGVPWASTTAQSPVQMTRSGSCGVTKAVSARTTPSAVMTSHWPRSTRTTRPGTRPWSAWGANSAAHASSQP